MLAEVGLLIVEKGGRMQVQTCDRPHEVKRIFDELAGNPSDAPWRATFVSMSWKDGKFESVAESKELPKPMKAPEWGYRLGSGPMPEPPNEEK